MPQNEHIELSRKRFGRALDYEERVRKDAARAPVRLSRFSRDLVGIRAKLFHSARFREKAEMKRKVHVHAQKDVLRENEDKVVPGAVPRYEKKIRKWVRQLFDGSTECGKGESVE